MAKKKKNSARAMKNISNGSILMQSKLHLLQSRITNDNTPHQYHND